MRRSLLVIFIGLSVGFARPASAGAIGDFLRGVGAPSANKKAYAKVRERINETNRQRSAFQGFTTSEMFHADRRGVVDEIEAQVKAGEPHALTEGMRAITEGFEADLRGQRGQLHFDYASYSQMLLDLAARELPGASASDRREAHALLRSFVGRARSRYQTPHINGWVGDALDLAMRDLQTGSARKAAIAAQRATVHTLLDKALTHHQAKTYITHQDGTTMWLKQPSEALRRARQIFAARAQTTDAKARLTDEAFALESLIRIHELDGSLSHLDLDLPTAKAALVRTRALLNDKP